jgi:ParB family transcriptional regulator, chromosome partitioning protein
LNFIGQGAGDPKWALAAPLSTHSKFKKETTFMSGAAALEVAKENLIVQEIPLDHIQTSANNPRGSMDSTALSELADSIKTHGVLQPILVRPAADGMFEIICGERRYRAAKNVGKVTIPARIVNLSDSEALECATVENLARENLHELEEAEAYARILATSRNYTPEILSKTIGKSVSHVYRRLQFLKLDPKLKQLFLDGKMTAGHALVLARLQPRDQKEIVNQLKQSAKNGAVEFPSVSRLQEYVEQNFYLDLNAAPFDKDSTNLIPEAGPCTTCPKRTGFNPSLFPEVKEKETCTDRECFQQKIHAFVELKIKEAPPETVKISAVWSFPGNTKPEGVLTRDEYRESKKGGCDHTVPAIVVDGERIGKMKWVCVSREQECAVHGASYRYIGENPEAKAERLKREAEARLEVKRRHAVFEAIREKARQDRNLDLDDFRLAALGFFQRLQFDTAKQFVILNGFITPGIAKKRKIEPTGEDNGRGHTEYFEGLVNNASQQELGAWLVELALIQHRDRTPYSYTARPRNQTHCLRPPRAGAWTFRRSKRR